METVEIVKKVVTDHELQEECRGLVHREVYYCVSALISEMSSKEEYQDELLDIRVKYVDYKQCNDCDSSEIDVDEDECPYCDSEDLSEYEVTEEALEHWIVSDNLARRLKEQGEMILDDFYGLTIWGRTTSGQAILLDGVIEDIVKKFLQ